MLQHSPKELTSTISSKGQVTVPVQVRRHLGLNANDKVAFIVEVGGNVKLVPASYPTIGSLQGAAGKLKQPLSWKEVKKVANEDRSQNKHGQ